MFEIRFGKMCTYQSSFHCATSFWTCLRIQFQDVDISTRLRSCWSNPALVAQVPDGAAAERGLRDGCRKLAPLTLDVQPLTWGTPWMGSWPWEGQIIVNHIEPWGMNTGRYGAPWVYCNRMAASGHTMSLDALNYFELTLQKKKSESTSCRKMQEWMRRGVIGMISAMKSWSRFEMDQRIDHRFSTWLMVHDLLMGSRAANAADWSNLMLILPAGTLLEHLCDTSKLWFEKTNVLTITTPDVVDLLFEVNPSLFFLSPKK